MQIRLNDRANAADAVKMAAGFTGRRGVESADFLRLSTDERTGQLLITACGELGVAWVEVECDVILPGVAYVRADMLAGLLARIPDERVLLGLDTKAKGVRVKAGRNSYLVRTLDAARDSDWMARAAAPDASTAFIDAVEFLDALDFVQHACAINDVRYYLNGVCLELRPDSVRLIATDGHRMAAARIKCAQPIEGELIIPARTAQRLGQVLSREHNLSLWLEGGAFCISDAAGLTFRGVAIEGKFPDWRRTVPATVIQVDTDCGMLAGAVERALVISAQEAFKWVDLTADPSGTLALTFDAKISGLDEVLEARTDTPARATLNPEYLSVALGAFGKQGASLGFNPNPDGVFKIETTDGERLAVIMPVRK